MDGLSVTPGAEADQEVGPVMAEPPLVMVNSTCPVLLLQMPTTLMLDLSQTSVAVGVRVGVLVAVFVGVLVGVLVAVFVAVLVGVFVTVGVSVNVAVGVAVEASQVASALASPVPGCPTRC